MKNFVFFLLITFLAITLLSSNILADAKEKTTERTTSLGTGLPIKQADADELSTESSEEQPNTTDTPTESDRSTTNSTDDSITTSSTIVANNTTSTIEQNETNDNFVHDRLPQTSVSHFPYTSVGVVILFLSFVLFYTRTKKRQQNC